MEGTQFSTWCKALRAAPDDVDALPPQKHVVFDSDARDLVDALAEHLDGLRAGGHYDYSPKLGMLLDALLAVGSRQQPWLRKHEAKLVGALATWIENVEHGDDCLVGLAQLDTPASLVVAIAHVADMFQMREIGGHARVIDAVPRKTPNVRELFPRLLEPLQRQQDKSLVWDRWHVALGAAISRLASDLHKAGRITPHPLAPVALELTMLLAGGVRLCTELEAAERKAFKAALTRIAAETATA